jgi:hypothetical protein
MPMLLASGQRLASHSLKFASEFAAIAGVGASVDVTVENTSNIAMATYSRLTSVSLVAILLAVIGERPFFAVCLDYGSSNRLLHISVVHIAIGCNAKSETARHGKCKSKDSDIRNVKVNCLGIKSA